MPMTLWRAWESYRTPPSINATRPRMRSYVQEPKSESNDQKPFGPGASVTSSYILPLKKTLLKYFVIEISGRALWYQKFQILKQWYKLELCPGRLRSYLNADMRCEVLRKRFSTTSKKIVVFSYSLHTHIDASSFFLILSVVWNLFWH